MNNRIATLLGNEFFLSDGGLETDLFFNKGIDLPHMAAFTLTTRQGGGRFWKTTMPTTSSWHVVNM
ncbi:hypothetical protein [Desertivirga xinjiangensis]|uniref:hypothetical protein n=1 Tax=Desertivirga xinjiangensis TaxID=539206 RepID=UPI00210C2C23|nr:hypothetical protein [Pedobacter xinjiangensis]